jgi:hypothetical protein
MGRCARGLVSRRNGRAGDPLGTRDQAWNRRQPMGTSLRVTWLRIPVTWASRTGCPRIVSTRRVEMKKETPRGSLPNSPRRGRNTSARGNAPGTEQVVNPDPCPERAKPVCRRPESCVALPGLGVEGIPRGPRALPWADLLRPLPSRHMSDRLLRTQKTRSDSMFRKADPDPMLSSGTTYVRIFGAEIPCRRSRNGLLHESTGEDPGPGMTLLERILLTVTDFGAAVSC